MSTISTATLVLPGGRIELQSPQLREGDTVRVTVETAVASRRRGGQSLLAFLDSLPPGPRSAASWKELEDRIQEERDAWDR
jgi:hypothetical protein